MFCFPRRLKYYRRFMDPNLQQLQLFGVYKLTQRDSDLAFHRCLVLPLNWHHVLALAAAGRRLLVSMTIGLAHGKANTACV